MKKVLKVLFAAVMCLALTATVFAAPSPSVNGVVKNIVSATDAGGNDVSGAIHIVELGTHYTGVKDEVEKVKNAETLKSAMQEANLSYEDGMQVVDMKDVYATGNIEYPVTVTFSVTGVTAGSTVALMYYDVETGKWVKVDNVVAGDGTITGTFSILGPVAFIVKNPTVTAGSTATSPKTGQETATLPMAVAVAALAGMAISFYMSKRKEA